MSPTTPEPTGLFSSLRHLLQTALNMAQVRLELFGSELEQEKLRLFDALLLAALGLLLAGLALILSIAFVVLLFQPQYRLPAIGVLTLLLAAGAYGLLKAARRGLQARDGGAFALTLGELRRDRSALAAEAAAASEVPPPAAPPAAPPAP